MTTQNKTTKLFLSIFASIETIVGAFFTMLVNTVINNITKLTPIAAPIPPAYSVYVALIEGVHAPNHIALVGALAIEISGMFMAKIAIAAFNWNQQRTKSENKINDRLAVGMTGLFFAVVIGLSLTIEYPTLLWLVYPGFILVAIAVYVNFAIFLNLESWQTEKSERLALNQLKSGVKAELRQAKKDLNQAMADMAKFEEDSQKVAKQLRDDLASLTQQKLSLTQEIDRLSAAKLAQEQPEKQTGKIDRKNGQISGNGHKPEILTEINADRKMKKSEILEQLPGLVGEGLTNSQIGEIVGRNERTIRDYKKQLNGKLQVAK